MADNIPISDIQQVLARSRKQFDSSASPGTRVGADLQKSYREAQSIYQKIVTLNVKSFQSDEAYRKKLASLVTESNKKLEKLQADYYKEGLRKNQEFYDKVDGVINRFKMKTETFGRTFDSILGTKVFGPLSKGVTMIGSAVGGFVKAAFGATKFFQNWFKDGFGGALRQTKIGGFLSGVFGKKEEDPTKTLIKQNKEIIRLLGGSFAADEKWRKWMKAWEILKMVAIPLIIAGAVAAIGILVGKWFSKLFINLGKRYDEQMEQMRQQLGVSKETRDIARQRAVAAGLTVGERQKAARDANLVLQRDPTYQDEKERMLLSQESESKKYKGGGGIWNAFKTMLGGERDTVAEEIDVLQKRTDARKEEMVAAQQLLVVQKKGPKAMEEFLASVKKMTEINNKATKDAEKTLREAQIKQQREAFQTVRATLGYSNTGRAVQELRAKGFKKDEILSILPQKDYPDINNYVGDGVGFGGLGYQLDQATKGLNLQTFMDERMADIKSSLFGIPKSGDNPDWEDTFIPAGKGEFFNKRSGANMGGLKPKTRSDFVTMASEYHKKTGRKITVNSAFRSPEEQEKLYKMHPDRAAIPGTSPHERGKALDINSPDAEWLDQHGLLRRYGFARNARKADGSLETWHIQQARKGAVIPDAPNDQLLKIHKGEGTLVDKSENFKVIMKYFDMTKGLIDGLGETSKAVPKMQSQDVGRRLNELKDTKPSRSGEEIQILRNIEGLLSGKPTAEGKPSIVGEKKSEAMPSVKTGAEPAATNYKSPGDIFPTAAYMTILQNYVDSYAGGY